jgi:hypothetical protein
MMTEDSSGAARFYDVSLVTPPPLPPPLFKQRAPVRGRWCVPCVALFSRVQWWLRRALFSVDDKKSDDVAPQQASFARRIYGHRRAIFFLTLGACLLLGGVTWLTASVRADLYTLAPTPAPTLRLTNDAIETLAPPPPPPPPIVFARYLGTTVPGRHVSLALSCDELVQGNRSQLHPYHLPTSVDAALRAAQRDSRNGDLTTRPLIRAFTLAELHQQAEHALATFAELECVCAPMFGELRRHVAVRNGSLSPSSSVIHLHNPVVKVPANATLVDDVRERQDAFFQHVGAAVSRSSVRMSDIVVGYRVHDVRCTSVSVDDARAALHLRGERARCVQMCMDLLSGRSIYDDNE